jgi:anti-sigma regulatory factor (Ser/Thr protein kinase)
MTPCAPAPFRSAMVMRSDSRELGKLTQWIVAACAAAQIPEKTSFAVQLCLDEAVTNILQHGLPNAEGGARATAIAASLERGACDVVLAIEDDGEAFDPTGVAAPPPASTLELLPVGGRGIHFMRRYSSRMEYSRSGGRNRLRLTFSAA